jgi:preprotein translocase SecE subunit
MARNTRRNRQSSSRGSLAAPTTGKAKSQSGGAPVARKSLYRRTVQFGGEVRAELGKVDYLNRQQTIQATLVVLGACILVGLYLYGLDQVFARFAQRLIDFQN